MSSPRCPKCKGLLVFYETDIDGDGCVIKSPHWSCIICGKIFYPIGHNCKRCKNNLAFSENNIECIYCGHPIFSAKLLEKVRRDRRK